MIENVFIQGKPIPQGSVSPMPFRRKNGKMGVNVFQKPELLQWRERIAETVLQYKDSSDFYPKETPVMVFLSFRLLKPKSAKREQPCCKGLDLDKAVRAVLDALTGVTYDDDCQVCYIMTMKVYVPTEEQQGVSITVKPYSFEEKE